MGTNEDLSDEWEPTEAILRNTTPLPRMELRIAFSKAPWVPALGFVRAVERLRLAAADIDEVPVYIALFEAVSWLSSLERDPRISCERDVQAVGFARDRAHHPWANLVALDEEASWIWQSETFLPFPQEVRYQGLAKLPIYQELLEDKPLLDVFNRLVPRITQVFPLPPPPP